VAARGLRRRAGVGGGSSGVGRLVGPRVLGLASGWATGGDKGILFFLRISFAESRREKLSAKKKTSYFLQIPFAESQPGRLSAKILCREPDVQALGKELLTFFIFFILELSFFVCICDTIFKYISKFGINLTFFTIFN
jgi:hypothetical protein